MCEDDELKLKSCDCQSCGYDLFNVEYDQTECTMVLTCYNCGESIEFRAYPEPFLLGL